MHGDVDQHAGNTPGFWPRGDAGAILEQREFVVPVLGSGISAPAGVPGADAVAAWIVANVEPADSYSEPDEPSLFRVAGEIGVDETELCHDVAQWRGAFDPEPTPVSEAIVQIPSRFIVTLNYDPLIELSAELLDIECEPLIGDEKGLRRAVELLADPSEWPPDKLAVVHLHGSLEAPDSIVLGPAGYQRLSQRANYSHLIWLLMNQKTMLFAGTTLDELQLLAEMRRHRLRDRRHVLLCRETERGRLTDGRAAISEAYDGIIIATFDDFAQLDGFAAKLATASPVAVPPEPVTAPAEDRAADLHYIPAVLVARDGAGPDESDALAAEMLGLAHGPQRLGEADLTLGQRTLIVGAPGSGKSEMMREAGGLVPPNEPAVLIRCAELEAASGDPSIVLANCAARGRGLNGTSAVNVESLRQRRFHFFLDGLDETRLARQAEVASLVVDLARAFPQHRFTVATRPVDVLEVFPRADHNGVGEWRVLQLAPDHDWQQRYLAAAGVTLEELEAQMPALRDLSELLTLPFFVSRTVELYRAGRLGALRDLLEVVQELVGLALERESQINLPVDYVKEWLRDLAVALHLSGRTSLGPDELAQLTLPHAVAEVIGSTDEIVQTLVSRLLLLERGQEYTFTHRIIGEALAAEALDGLDPVAPLLDAVAPLGGDEIGGVREDLVVPMTLLMGRNEAWRSAVGERDPLAAARSVPSSAPVEQRRSAAETIWETYLGLRIWMWDFGRPELLNDAAALGRLLGAGELDDLIERLRADIDHESPEVQGNAIRVLSFAGVSQLADDLARVLGDDERKSVVRRHAAIAARQIDAHELLPLIVRRATEAKESVEAQDCALCAIELAHDDELVDVAVALAGNRYARMIAEPRLRAMGSSPEQVRFLRAYAEREPDPYSLEASMLGEALGGLANNADDETIRDVAFVAAAWAVDDERLHPLIAKSHEAALRGFIEAIETDPFRMFALDPYLEVFSSEELQRAGAPGPVVERRRAMSGPVAPIAARPRTRPRPLSAADGAARETPPTLSELLARDRDQWDDVIARTSQRLASQVSLLSEEEKADLRARLDEWWPDKPFVQTIRRTGPNSWEQENRAAAWLWLGPPLDKRMTAEQWGQVASCGILFEDQLEWLRRHSSEESKQALATTCTSSDSQVWERALAATPDPLPDALQHALLRHLTESTDDYSLGQIGERLQSAIGPEPVRTLSEQSDEFADVLRPLLASAGDTRAQRTLIAGLRSQLEAHERPEDRRLGWLNAVTDESSLQDLFACLELLYGPASEIADTSAWVANDVLTPVMSAIRNIGGADAVRRYDQLIGKGGGMQFLHSQREVVAQAVLREEGLRAAEQAARALGVPVFSPEQS
jgi:energy-coupling factor transporter ATP-binding protein EcfA2